MVNFLDSKLSDIQKEYAQRIIREYGFNGLKVTYVEKTNSLSFRQDRRTVCVPLKLVETESWSDIRFLFRAILEAPNSLWNHSADQNDWAGKNFYKE